MVLVYFAHSLLNLVDSFLLNLPRPETRPIWGLIGQTAMELADFQVKREQKKNKYELIIIQVFGSYWFHAFQFDFIPRNRRQYFG